MNYEISKILQLLISTKEFAQIERKKFSCSGGCVCWPLTFFQLDFFLSVRLLFSSISDILIPH